MFDQQLVVTGDGALSTALAQTLRQCGLDSGADDAPPCHVAAHDDGVCWSFADVRSQAPVAPALAAFRRAASWGPAATAADGREPRISHKIFTTIAAQQIAHHILRPSRERPPAGAVTFLDRRTLRTSTHNVTVHPYDVPAEQRTYDELRRERRKLRHVPALSRHELTERWQRLADERFGAFANLDNTQLRQLPLKVTLARMSDPCGMLSAPPAVAGAGIDSQSARERAMVQALEAYASIVVDPRLLVDKEGAFLGPRDGDATRLLGPVRDGSVAAFVRAIDLTDGRERLLPAPQAFPALLTPEPSRAPAGTSVALDWRQALTHGLLQHCVRLTVSGSSGQARRPSALTTEDFDQDPGIRFLAAMRRAADIDLTLHDITGPAGVPVVACAQASGETVYGGGADLAEAVREALTAALFHYQFRRDPVLQAAIPAPSAIWTNPASTGAECPDRLVQALTSLGYTPSVFALDHDRAVYEAFPCTLRVVLADPS